MKRISLLLSLVTVLALAAPVARADIFTDAVGDFTGGTAPLDMTSVAVNNDTTTLTFTINLAGDPTGANWYNYYIGISRNLFGGVGGNLNGSGGWGKNIQMSTGGMDYFVGAYPSFAERVFGDGTFNHFDADRRIRDAKHARGFTRRRTH